MLLDFVRQLNASKNFSIKEKFEFIEFDDVTEGLQDKEPGELEIWAAVKLHYDGDIPESYKVLNYMIGDWVENHLEALTVEIHKELKDHFQKNYPESDSSALDQLEDTAIWTEQLDYMPVADLEAHCMTVEIELVLHGEPIEEEG